MYKLSRVTNFHQLCRLIHTENNHYDVIIAGGGMVGSTMALTLSNNKYLKSKRILLLERQPKAEFKLTESFNPRVSALSGSTCELFKSLGVWDHIKALRFKPIAGMHVWDGCSDAQITFTNDNQLEDLAYIVENSIILHAIEKELTNINALTAYSTKISTYEFPKHENEPVKLHLDDTSVLTCDLLIGADGPTSRVRKEMGVHYLTWSYDQKSIIGNIRLSEPSQNNIAYQKFTPNGPIALLPLSETECSLVWSTTVEEARKLMKLPNDQFIDALNDALWQKITQNEIITKFTKSLNSLLKRSQTSPLDFIPQCIEVEDKSRACYPLAFGHATNYVALKTVLIGDAAHRVHPLAGQGVNIGFQDVEILAKLISEYVYRGDNIGMEMLREYERKSQINNVPLVFGIDALYKLYSTKAAPFVLARSVGLEIVNSIPMVKKAFMARAGV